jgi:hypothetical protein
LPKASNVSRLQKHVGRPLTKTKGHFSEKSPTLKWSKRKEKERKIV